MTLWRSRTKSCRKQSVLPWLDFNVNQLLFLLILLYSTSVGLCVLNWKATGSTYSALVRPVAARAASSCSSVTWSNVLPLSFLPRLAYYTVDNRETKSGVGWWRRVVERRWGVICCCSSLLFSLPHCRSVRPTGGYEETGSCAPAPVDN